MTVTPSGVQTPMNPATGFWSITAAHHSKAVLDHLGWHEETWGSWWHAFQMWLDERGPICWVRGPYTRYTLAVRFSQRRKQ